MTGSNIGATGEIGEPNHHDSSNPLASTWWQWTAPFSGIAEFNTLGSEFDTTLALYSGTALDALTKHASNDDFNGRASRVRLAVVAGRTYRIAVDGYAAAQGFITLNLVEVDYARPDVFTRPSAGYGANVYYPDRQDISSGVKRGATRSINVHVRNNGNRSDAFLLRLSAAHSTRGLTTTLVGPDGNEVAAQARSGTLLTPMLVPGQTATYTLKVRASARRSEHGYRYNATLRASNSGDAPAFDQVRVSITVR